MMNVPKVTTSISTLNVASVYETAWPIRKTNHINSFTIFNLTITPKFTLIIIPNIMYNCVYKCAVRKRQIHNLCN